MQNVENFSKLLIDLSQSYPKKLNQLKLQSIFSKTGTSICRTNANIVTRNLFKKQRQKLFSNSCILDELILLKRSPVIVMEKQNLIYISLFYIPELIQKCVQKIQHSVGLIYISLFHVSELTQKWIQNMHHLVELIYISLFHV